MKYVNEIDLFNGLNLNPVPLEFDNEMTTTKFLAGMQAKVNEVVKTNNENIDDINNRMETSIQNIEKKAQEEYEKINETAEEINNTIGNLYEDAPTITMAHTIKNLQANSATKTELNLVDKRLSDEIIVERARIDNIVNLEEGSTTGDAELLDARIDYTGKTWDTAGNSIRGIEEEFAKLIYPNSNCRAAFIFCDPINNKAAKVSLEDKKIIFGNYAVLCYGAKRYNLSNKEIDFSSHFASGYLFIYFSLVTFQFNITGTSLTDVSDVNGWIYIGMIFYQGLYTNLSIYPYYLVNGKITFPDDKEILNFQSNKNLYYNFSVLGDSISSFSGISEANASYYPRGDITDVSQMWWKIIEKEMRFISQPLISAISGSAYMYQNNILPAYADDRINRLGYSSFIFINMGTNDPFFIQTGESIYNPDIEFLNELTNSTAKGIALTIRKIQNKYPNAKIILLIPKQVNLSALSDNYTPDRVAKIAKIMKETADALGVYKIIDLRKCGINQTNILNYTIDGIHPNAAGMQIIADYIIYQLLN